MGFLTGRASFARFRVSGAAPGMFGPEHLERLEQYALGKQRAAASDGVEVGWIAGDHILDTSFDLEKNVVNDALHFSLRIDTNKLPSELLKAYAAIELKALVATNPSGRPSNRQRREARDSARRRIEDEAKDGRFLKRKAYPLMWDALSNELLIGSTSQTVTDRLHTLFEHTFGTTFEPVTSGSLAGRLAQPSGLVRNLDDAGASAFVPGVSPQDVAWVLDEMSRDFLGNEFLLWLWYHLENEEDTLKLSDGSDVAVMMAATLTLECPRGQTGKESITHEGPTRLPEARRAVQSGKMPRKAGLVLVRQNVQYEMTMGAEGLTVNGARFPASEETEERARLEERVTQVRELLQTVDLLYEVFVLRRLSGEWAKELGKMQKWLHREERARMSATA